MLIPHSVAPVPPKWEECCSQPKIRWAPHSCGQRGRAGQRTVRALADGVEFGRAEFQVTTFGQAFVYGAQGRYALPDFPRPGSTAVIEWDERSQNFVIVGTE